MPKFIKTILSSLSAAAFMLLPLLNAGNNSALAKFESNFFTNDPIRTNSFDPEMELIYDSLQLGKKGLKKEAFNLQGLTFNENESQLFIADYLKGILKISMKNPSDRNWLNFPKETTVKGIDGLLWHKNSLVAIHNGVKPIRIIQYSLNQNNEISGFKILDHNRPEFNEPALATISNGKLYFFSNAPWSAYDKNLNLNETQFENPILYSNSLAQ